MPVPPLRPTEKSWAMPKGREVWLLFDQANGDEGSRRYVWWFDTKGAALAHRRHQHRHPSNAKLSMPIRFKRMP